MPIAGNTPIQPGSRKAYFDSLYQLDAWRTNLDQKPEDVLPYVPRNHIRDPRLESKGKLLVCHDFKGGYNESPFSLSYTFNFWSMNDIFVYFSHHLVTVPPPAWVHAAHRHGVKILGVLLFEHTRHGPELRLLLSGTSAPLGSTSFSPSLYYPAALADLASQRGFDGYLLNFELSMSNNAAQALVGWVRILREELWKKVGPHAEVIWYDSVITTGKVSYQNKLNEHNLPYFLSSTGFFSNYWWQQDHPHDTMEYFYSLNTNLLNTRAISPSVPSGSLTHQDVFMGIDVFGRNSFGGGGFDTHLALEVISPDGLGLGAALFAPGWTWESRQDDAGRTWGKWWKEEVTFWTGNVLGSDLKRLVKSQGSHVNEYRPIGHYFNTKPPPDPRVLPFFSTFSPGSGRAWWVEGERVWNGPTKDHHWTVGWLDIDKQGSIGDLVWPVPTISWNAASGPGNRQPLVATPVMQVFLNFDEAWNGGSSLKFLLSEPFQKVGQVQHKRSLWMPVQSLSLTPGQSYTATAVYKMDSVKAGVVPNMELRLRLLDPLCDSTKVEVVSENKSSAFRRNWTGLRTAIRVTSNTTEPVTLALGFTFDIEGEAPANQECFSFSLGQVNVYASDRDGQVNGRLQAAFTSAQQDQDGTVEVPALEVLDGILTWEAPSPHTSPSIFERYTYWNIYIHLLSSLKSVSTEKPSDARWIGTSGPDYCGEKNRLGRFVVLGKNITSCISVDSGEGTLRFYIQGVTECGEMIPWQNVIQTDARFKFQGGTLARIERLALG
ncbi:Glycosyl hydrolase family 85 domain containing protein [Amanita muscaria]